MADAGQFAKDADILLRIGANAATAVKVAGFFDEIVKDQEANINCMARFDFTAQDAATTLNASVRGILVDTAASLAAIVGIQYDMSSFTSRTEAEDQIDVLRDISLRNMSILRDKKVQNFIVTPTRVV